MKIKAIHAVRVLTKKGPEDKAPGEIFDLEKDAAEELVEMGAAEAVARTKTKSKAPEEKPEAKAEPKAKDELLG